MFFMIELYEDIKRSLLSYVPVQARMRFWPPSWLSRVEALHTSLPSTCSLRARFPLRKEGLRGRHMLVIRHMGHRSSELRARGQDRLSKEPKVQDPLKWRRGVWALAILQPP